MSTTNEELRVKILDAKKAETELKNVRKELEKTTGASEGHGKASHKQAGGVEHVTKASSKLRSALSYGAALTGIGAVGYGLKDVVQGGIQAQEQQALLQDALKSTGQGGAKHLEKLNKAVDYTSSHGGFSAIEETQGLAQFVRLTGKSGRALTYQSAALRLARGAHLEYGAVVKMVSQINTGSVGRLQKYLGVIQPVTSHVDALKKGTKEGNQATKESIQLYRIAHPGVKIIGTAMKEVNKEALAKAKLQDKEATTQEALTAINKKYGTSLKTYSSTAAGSISNANNEFKTATEQLGKKLLPVVTEGAKDFSKLITAVSEGHGIWGTLERDGEKVVGDLKDVYHWFSENSWLAKDLAITFGSAFAAEKVLKFYSALKKLEIVKAIASASERISFGACGCGGAGAAAGAEGEAGGAAAAAGGGGAAEAAIPVVGYLGLAHLVKSAQSGLKGLALAQGESGGREHLGHKQRKEIATSKAQNESALEKEAQKYGQEDQAKLRQGDKPIVLDVHVHLDGKEIAHSVGDHAIKDQKVARKLAEGAHGYVIRMHARH